ncbi:unnamed protein product [Anisakis simplex]|uniref:AMP-binding domain-containing protein n=1 Tax=Anisakis simplex TaxID=6269 RepID=A0A0M3JR56_ANISI|nr:unnamed protein product [Anisakis simplex]
MTFLTFQTDHETDVSITYAKLRDDSFRFANWLENHGARKGDIICVMLANCSEYAIAFLGAALVGSAISGISPESTQGPVAFQDNRFVYLYEFSAEVKHFLSVTNAKFLVSAAERYDVATLFEDRLTVIIVGKEIDQDGHDFATEIRQSKLDYSIEVQHKLSVDDTLITPFSSGTTGPPKCVQLTHRNYNASTAILRKALFDELSGGLRRVTAAVLPFFHGSGFWALCFCLLEGHRVVTLKHFHPMMMLQIIDQYKVDTFNVVPTIIRYLCECGEQFSKWDVSSMRTVLCGSAALGKQISRRFLNKYPNVENLVQGYGMTELVVLSHLTPLGTPFDDKYLGSCGKLLPGFEAKLISDENGDEIKESGKCGELLVRSEAIMKGYLRDDDATKNAIDADNWLHTGDYVYYDDEGFYYIVDRIKDLIKVNGLQVSPSEMEDLLMSHPNIKDAAVTGIADEHFGEVNILASSC